MEKTFITSLIKILFRLQLVLLAAMVLSGTVNAQPYIDCHTVITQTTPIFGSNEGSLPTDIIIIDGFTFTVFETEISEFPVVNGSPPVVGGRSDLYIGIWDADCNQVFGTYYGGDDDDVFEDFVADDAGNLVIQGRTTSSDFPTTDGSTIGTSSGHFILSIAPDGSINYSTMFHPNLGFNNAPAGTAIRIDGNNIYHVVEDIDFGGTFQPFVELYISDATTGTTISSSMFLGTCCPQIELIPSGGAVLHLTETIPGSLTTTDGTTGQQHTIIFDAAGNIVAHTAIDNIGEVYDIAVDDTGIYFTTTVSYSSFDTDFPSTDGTSAYDPGSPFAFPSDDIGVVAYDLMGNLTYATLLGSSGDDEPTGLAVMDGMVFMLTYAFFNFPESDFQVVNGNGPSGTNFAGVVLTKLNPDGTINYSTYNTIGASLPRPGGFVLNDLGQVHIAGWVPTFAAPFPTTDGSSGTGIYFQKYDTDGSLIYSTIIGMGGGYPPIWDDETSLTGDTLTFLLLTAGGADNTANLSTDGTAGDGSTNDPDFSVVRVALCPPVPTVASDVLSPATITGCINGALERILGEEITIDPADLPQVYDQNVLTDQTVGDRLTYQWQFSLTDPAGTPVWQDVGGALGNQQSFTPPPSSQDVWYRRLTTTSECCGNSLVSTSTITFVDIDDTQTAPEPDAGGQFYACPGQDITIGNPDNNSVTGGTPPYTYEWSNGATTPTQTLTINQSSVFTLTVTDDNDCEQVDQARVEVYQADAGPDQNICDGDDIQLGGSPLAGIPIVDFGSPLADSYSIAYTWTPAVELDNSNIPNPTTSTGGTYVLTVTLYQPDGTSCQTTDDVTVTASTAPTTLNFAGPDIVVCTNETALVGTPAEAGYTYIWTPGANITDGNIAQPTFDPGSDVSSPNPITYTVTANIGECNYYDQVTAYIIEARAGNDGCGPRYIGVGDRTPNIDETYSWQIISSDPGATSTFQGPTDEAVVPVSGNTVGTTIYELTTTFVLDGVTYTCSDQVEVPPCGCLVSIEAETENCLDFDLNGPTLLRATAEADDNGVATNPDDFIYTWSPEMGLDTYTGREVTMQDNVDRTYTVTATSIIDPSFSCDMSIRVNNPANAAPVFPVTSPIVTCPGDPVNIGNPASNPGLIYSWEPADLLDDPSISFPEATVSSTTDFTVRVTDAVTGCFIEEMVTVDVGALAAAGPDIFVCDNGTVTLGSTPIAGYTYSWEPAGSDWRDDNNDPDPTQVNEAMPNVFVSTIGGLAASQTFTLTTTSPDGCISMDEVTVFVSPTPDPFSLTDLTFCPTDPPVVLGFDNIDGTGTNQVPSGSAYLWSPGNLLDDPTAQNPTLNTPLPNEEVTFTLAVIGGNSCNQISNQTITPTNVDIPIVNPAVVCLNEPVNIGSSSNNTGTYTWTAAPGNPTGGILDDPNIGNPVFTSNTAGSFTYTVTTVGSCTGEAEVTITVQEVTAPDITSPTICQGQSVVIGPEPEGGLTYGWSPSTGLSDPGVAQPTFTGTSSQNYVLTIFNGTGCFVEVPVGVTVSAEASPTVVIADTINVCYTDQQSVVLDATVTPSGTYTYNWTPSDFLSNDNVEDPTLLITGPGTYTYDLVVSSQTTGCNSANDGVDVTIIAGTIDECSATANNTQLAGGETLELFAAGETDDTYSWVGPDGFTSSDQNPTVTNFNADKAGTYMVTVANDEGCSVSCSVTVFLLPNFDLALQKVLSVGQLDVVSPGDDVSFTITVFNQGTLDATNIDVTDYIPTNTTYSASGQTPSGSLVTSLGNTVGFTNNDDGTYTIDALAGGDNLSFDIVLSVGLAATGTITNNAEIVDADGGTDEDSPLTDISGTVDNTDEVDTNDDIADDSNGGVDNDMDEDDWDPEQFSLCELPEVLAFAIQPTCDNDGAIASDGYVQLSSVTGGLSYSINSGSTFDGSGIRTTLNGVSYPLQILTDLANPTGSQDYTIRVYIDDVGGDDACFTDIMTTMNEQDCTVGCECNDYLFLNDEDQDVVHKFSIDPVSGNLTEVGDPFITSAIAPISPHGLMVDNNGNLFIGQADGFSNAAVNGPIFKFTGLGELIDNNVLPSAPSYPFNFASKDGVGYLAYPRDNEIRAYDLCTGRLIGAMSIDSDNDQLGAISNQRSWGFYIDDNSWFLPEQITGWVFSGSLDTLLFTAPAGPGGDEIFQAVDNLGTPFTFGSAAGIAAMGITRDAAGNYYIVINNLDGDSPSGSKIVKYDSNGNYVSEVNDSVNGGANTLNGQAGFYGARGLVYSASTDQLYVANFENCISVFDTNLAEQASQNIGNPTDGTPKGLAITTECCPTNNNQVFDASLCSSEMGEEVFLNEIFDCEGPIVEAPWVPADAASQAIYDECSQSIMPDAPPGCYSFTRTSDGTNSNSQCGAFVQTFNISIGEVTASIVAGNQEICEGDDPIVFTVTTAATGSAALSFQWSVSSESDSTGFMPITGATMEAYDPTPADLVADTMYFRNEVSIIDCAGEFCRDTSNVVLVITSTNRPTVTVADPGTICSSQVIDLTLGASISPADLGGTWSSSGNGDFTTGTDFATATTYVPGSGDITAGQVTLTLTTNDPDGACEADSASVIFQILNVDCGTFPWDGNE